MLKLIPSSVEEQISAVFDTVDFSKKRNPTSQEVEILRNNNNFSSDTDFKNLFVEDDFDANLIKNSEFSAIASNFSWSTCFKNFTGFFPMFSHKSMSICLNNFKNSVFHDHHKLFDIIDNFSIFFGNSLTTGFLSFFFSDFDRHHFYLFISISSEENCST